MKTVIQRVKCASVESGDQKSSIGKGLLIFVGLEQNDTFESCLGVLKKIPALRIFEDAAGKTNVNLPDAGGSILWISQFTLAADLKSGNRPSFTTAMGGVEAREMFHALIEKMRKDFPGIAQEMGFFGESMLVSLENDGPFTLVYP